MQGNVCLRHNPDAAALPIHDRNTPDLVFPHALLTHGNILAVAAGYRLQRKDPVNLCRCRIQAFGNHIAAKVTVCDYAHQFA